MRQLTILFVLNVAIFSVSPLGGQQVAGPYTDSRTIPETPAYRRAQELVKLINAGDASAVEAYLKAHFMKEFLDSVPMSEHLGIFDQLHSMHGDLKVYSARNYDPPRPPSQAVLIVRGKNSEAWRGITVEVEESEPHGIVGMMVSLARPPSDLPQATRLSDSEIAEQLGTYVDRLVRNGHFSGTLLLAKDGNIVLTKAHGIANRDFDAPVTLDTKFNLGSMNKMMTAVACLQLVEAGKLSLDDPVSKFLSEDWLPNVDKSKVQIKHLLTHTSGLGSYFTDAWDRSSRALYRSVDDWKPVCQDEKLAFEPGTSWQYSNTGMLIAGAVIEKASGMDYYEYVRQNITSPAGMLNTGFFETDRVNRNLAVGYEKERDGAEATYRNNLYQHVVRGGPAGGGYSTVEDLLKFDHALRQKKLVSQASLDQLWQPYPALSSKTYGLGFDVSNAPTGRIVGHGGGFSGISASLKMYLDAGYTVAVLANLGAAADLVDEKARELIAQGR